MKWLPMINIIWFSLVFTSLMVLFVQDTVVMSYGIAPLAKFAYLALIGIISIGVYGSQMLWKRCETQKIVKIKR